VIQVNAFTKLYGRLAAVENLSFTVASGEVLGLVGPNGAGKTTTLRAIAGIIAPTSGSISISGFDLATEPVRAKSQLSFIPDEPHLFEYLTVEEHLRFVGRLYGVADAPERIPGILRELELDEKSRSLPGELSRGMKQKLAIACGLLHSPAALVLDEPLTVLDPAGMRRMKNTIVTRASEGAAIIISSHLLTLVEELCTRILIIRRGHAVAYGSLDEIVGSRPELAGRSIEDVFLALTEEISPAAP
jgi:ABC-2 type transport system ATP-binding protein